MVDNEKMKQFDALIKSVNSSKKYSSNDSSGKLLAKLSDKPLSVNTVSSGSMVLDQILGGGLAQGRLIEIYGAESSGKCVTKDTVVLTQDGLLSIEEIFAKFGQKTSNTTRVTDISDSNFTVVNENGNLERVVALTHNGMKKTRKLTLANGRSLTATLNHPIRVINESGRIVWIKVGDLVEGMTVVSYAGGSDQVGSETVSLNVAELLGYLISEGHLKSKNFVGFTNYYDEDIKSDYRRLIKEVADELGVEKEVKINEYDSVTSEGKTVEFRVNSTELRSKLYALGVDYSLSADKFVPFVIREGNVDIQKAFLSRLFEGDGWVEKSGQVGYASLSRKLVDEVQLMLLGLGINSSVNRRYNKQYDTESWTLLITQHGSKKFVQEIGFVSERKNLAASERVLNDKEAVEYATSVPFINELVLDLVNNVGGDRESGKLTYDLTRNNATVSGVLLRVSQKRLSKIVQWVESRDNISAYAQQLLDMVKFYEESNYSYSTITTIVELEKQPTFDLALEDTHSFVANGIVNHNTSIALTALGNVQKNGGTAVFIDAENALDPKYAAKLGVDLDNLAVAQPDSAEQALNLMQDLTESGVVDVIVLDSIAALVPQAELDGDAGDHTIGLIARLLSKQLKKLIKPANQTNTTILFINQTRDAIGSFSPYGTPQTTTGGKAMKFYASQRIEIKKGQQVKGDSGDKEIIGNQIKFKIVKNKVAPPFGTGESVLTFNQGINVPAEIMEVGEKYGIVKKPNNRTYVETETGEIFGKSKAEALEALKTNPELLNRLIEASKVKITEDLYDQNSENKPVDLDDELEDDDE